MPGHRPALDRGRHQPVDVEPVADQLEQAQLGLLRPPVGGGHVAGDGVGRLAQRLRQRVRDLVESDVEPVILAQELRALGPDLEIRSGSKSLKMGRWRTIRPITSSSRSVIRPSAAATSTIVWMSAAW